MASKDVKTDMPCFAVRSIFEFPIKLMFLVRKSIPPISKLCTKKLVVNNHAVFGNTRPMRRLNDRVGDLLSSADRFDDRLIENDATSVLIAKWKSDIQWRTTYKGLTPEAG